MNNLLVSRKKLYLRISELDDSDFYEIKIGQRRYFSWRRSLSSWLDRMADIISGAYKS